jgi:serine/threonine-protein kinase PpkA
VDIPGFQIQREIGRGGMARVYLAVQRKLGRLVALKVVSDTFASDPEFRRRFVQESRINARLTHPNIVQVYDVGAHGSLLYLVMEYVGGGDLNSRLERGIRIDELIRVVKEIGGALDYAHNRGFVHRDIKPENILFREDGSAALSDFGIARMVDDTPTMSSSGTVVGTPQYMSPEQAAGRALDGRSDIYSLGVVFYRMLTGDVPYKAETAVRVGIKHLQEPIPRLPNYLSVFQEVIERALAKKPEQRFQSGAEFAAALDAIRHRPDVTSATVRTQAVTTEEIRAVGSALITSRDPVRSDRSAQRRQRRRLLTNIASVTAVVAVVAGGTLLFVQEPDRVTRLAAAVGIIDDPQVEDAWNSARSLRQDPNQSLATIVAAYRRVLSLDPQHRRAAEALAGLASQWKADIEAAIADGRLELAGNRLDESLAAFPEDDSLQILAAQLDNRRNARRLLTSTQERVRAQGLGDLSTAGEAIQAFHEVLRLAPGHPAAQAELDRLASHFAVQAAAAAEAGDVDQAIEFLDRASAANDRLPELAGARQQIQQATTLQTAISDMLQQASRHRADGHLINPPGGNAAELYHRVLSTDPENAIATQGLDEIESQVLAQARALFDRGELDTMGTLIARALAVGLDAGSLSQLKTRLDAESARRTRVADRLTRAEHLLAQGFITEPADANAVALLRDVQRIDPGNTEAQVLLSRCAERLAEVAQEAYEVGLAMEARRYLELALTVTPDVAAWRDLRDRWQESSASI